MADSINIPIQILTKDALLEIKKFSKVATESVESINKVALEQNKIIEDTTKNVKGLNNGQKALIGTLTTVVGLAVLQSDSFRELIKNLKNVEITSDKVRKIIKFLGVELSKLSSISNQIALAAFAFKQVLAGLGVDIEKVIKLLDTIANTSKAFDNSMASLVGSAAEFASKGLKQINDLAEIQEEKFKKLIASFIKYGTVASSVGGILLFQNTQFVGLINRITKLNLQALDLIDLFKNVNVGLKNTTKVTGNLAKASIILDRGIIGLSLNLATASLAFGAISKTASQFDNKIADSIQKISLFASIISGSLSVALIFLIKKIADVTSSIGTSLANAAVNATNSFIEFDKKTFVFERTLKGFNRSFGESIGTIESWNKTIKKVSDSTGFTEKALRGAVTEITATTSAMGFTEEQQKKLLKITTDYARFLGDDVVKTTIEFIAGLNGQSQSVQKYGVKLNAANIQQKLYSKGLDTNFQKLSQNEKAQIRFNSVVDQWAPIAGNAAAVTETLAGQQIVLNNNITRLSQSFGEGAAIIENNNLVAASFNIILNNINETVIKTAGFFTSLVGRFLQVAGAILSVSVKALILVKALKLLNIGITSDFFQALTTRPIKLFGKSLIDLVKSSGATFVSFSSLTNVFKTFLSVAVSQGKVLISGLAESLLVLAKNIKIGLITALKLARSAVISLSKSFLRLLANPIVLTIIAATAAIYLLVKAFSFIEKKTGVFSELWKIMNEIMSETSFIIQPLIDLFVGFGEVIARLGRQIIGAFVVALSKVISLGLKLVQLNPFNIFSEDQIKRVSLAKERLDGFGDSIVAVNFDISRFGENTKRNLASVDDSIKKIDLAPLIQLQEELKEVGLSDIDKIKKERDERLAIIQDALKSEGKAAKIAKELELKINQDFNDQIGEITKKAAEKSLESMANYRKNIKSISDEIESSLATSGESIQSALSFQVSGKGKIDKDIDDELKKAKEEFDAGIIDEKTFEIRKKDLAKQRKDLARNSKLALGTGIANSFARGSAGATALGVGMSQMVADFLVPGLGQAAGPLLEVFAQGPEATKEAFNQFAETVPTVIENIILSIPAAIEAIADNADKIIVALVNKIDVIVIALVKAMPKVSTALAFAMAIDVPIALAKSMPQVAISLVKELVKALPQAFIDSFKEVFNKIGSIFSEFGSLIFDGLLAALTGGFSIIGNLFSSIFSFIGGGTGPVEDFLGFDFPFIAFAKGGLVPGSAPVSGDSSKNDVIPALLSPGEMVIPRSIMSGGAGSVVKFLEQMGLKVPGFFLGGVIGDVTDFLGDAIGSVVNSAGDIVGGIVGEVPVVGDIAEQFIDLFNKYREIIQSLARIGASVNLRDLLTDPFGVISNAVKGVLDFFKGNFRNLISLPFAKGGMVPNGFNNDTFPARLTSGELVVDRSTTRDLQDFLSSQGSQNSSNDTVTGLLAQLVGLMQKDQQINTTVEFNENTLADIILNLSRNNARLA